MAVQYAEEEILMPDGEISREASFQLILNLTSSVAILQHDMDRVSSDLRALRADTAEEKKEREKQSREHGTDIDRLEFMFAGLNNLNPEELRAVRRRMDADEGEFRRRLGLKWPILVGLFVVIVAACVNVAVTIAIHLLGG